MVLVGLGMSLLSIALFISVGMMLYCLFTLDKDVNDEFEELNDNMSKLVVTLIIAGVLMDIIGIFCRCYGIL